MKGIRYSDEFRENAVARYYEVGSYGEVAQELGITATTLSTWRRYADRADEPMEPVYQPVPLDSDVLNWFLLQLPANGEWTQDRRDKWVAAYVSFIDLIIEVVDDPPPTPSNSTG